MVRFMTTGEEPVFNYPACSPSPRTTGSDAVPISPKGRFTDEIRYAGGTTTLLGKAVVTGKFHSNGTEDGVLTYTSFVNPDCNGAADYSTKVH
jgi:hypothetical protein